MAKHADLSLDSVRIPEAFKSHPPCADKIAAKKAEYEARKDFAKAMVVDKDHVLVDGYAAFLALEELGVESARFKVRTGCAVVHGYHPANPGKIYKWRYRYGGKCAYRPGDHIAVATRFGIAEAVVTETVRMPAAQCLDLRITIGRWHENFAGGAEKA